MCFRKYYTDVHEVDEDATTILNQGGMWHDIGMAGVTFRYMAYDPSDIFGTVASKNNVQPPSLLGGCVMYLHFHSDDPLYGFQWLNIKTILGLYIAY